MLYISDFINDFQKKLQEIAPEEIKKEMLKHEKIIKHTLYMVVGHCECFMKDDAVKFQERFHVKIDQMVSDYYTWKKAGCKINTKPKQYVTGKIANTSKKAFDQVLNSYLIYLQQATPVVKKILPLKSLMVEAAVDNEPFSECG